MLEGILNVFRALLAPVIAGVVAYIAYQQHKTNRDKLRLDLFDKRHKIFQGSMSLLGLIAQQGDIKNEQLNLFLRETADAHFLFDKGISDYLDTIYKNAVQLHSYEYSIKTARSPAALLEKRGQLFDWFIAQFEVSKNKFGKYLRFADKKRGNMNWKRGFRRVTWILSIIIALAAGVYPVWVYIHDQTMWERPILPLDVLLAYALGAAIGWICVWVVYLSIVNTIIPLITWCIEGFNDRKPKGDQNNK